jgi:poly-beta-1,6-N-acetyl-D-glucosamine N-deacetylase
VEEPDPYQSGTQAGGIYIVRRRALTIALLTLAFCGAFLIIVNVLEQVRYKAPKEAPLSGNGCLVLSYHRIRTSEAVTKGLDKLMRFYSDNEELKLYSVYKDTFEEQLLYLLDHGYQFITPNDLNQLIKGKDSFPPKCALVTFDDVDVSVHKNAFPFLLKHQIPFTLFIITGEVGNPNFKGLEMAAWDQIQEMKDSGLATIGTHTHQMHRLDKKNNPPFLAAGKIEDFRKDTAFSIEKVKEQYGFHPVFFAYPYGFGIPETDESLLEAGFHLVFTLKPGIVVAGDPSFLIKRVLITKESWGRIEEWVESNVSAAEEQ